MRLTGSEPPAAGLVKAGAFLILVLLLFGAVPAYCEGLDFEQVAAKAGEMELGARREWRILLHCRNPEHGPCESTAFGEAFFLLPEGRDDPEVELRASLRDLWLPTAGKPPFQCRFPARFAWLREELERVGISVPDSACPDLEEWLTAIDPDGVSLIFPSSFLNNPASAFGHTLLRIDKPQQTENTRLVAYTANFAAETQGEDPLTYAVRGVFGGYRGFFSVAPYYEVVKQYNDLEDRDLWEYELTLTPFEARRLVLHLWELRRVPFVYYYFDENCSYQLLSVLEVARPTLRLTQRFAGWVLPIDTARAILEDEGILRGAVFRPSLATKLAHQSLLATPEQKRWALEAADPVRPWINRELSPGAPSDNIAALDLAYDAITYRTLRGELEGADREKRSWELLAARSRLSGESSIPPAPQPPRRPDQGHESGRFSVGAGREGGRWFAQYEVRPAFHEQLDPPAGYLPGTQIKFLEAALRHEEERGVDLQRLTIVDVESLSPRSDFVSPRSWHVKIGAERYEQKEKEDPLVYLLEGGAGAAYRLPREGLLYSLLEGEVQAGDDLEDGWSLGIGPRAGVLFQLADRWRTQLEGVVQRFFLGYEHTELAAYWGHDISISKKASLRLSLEHERILDAWETTGSISLHLFFSPFGSP